MAALNAEMGDLCRRALRAIICALALTCGACIPVDGGPGTPFQLPPTSNPPVFDPNTNGDDEPSAAALVFDVRISAESDAVSGIDVDATLSIELNSDGTPRQITLDDGLNGTFEDNPVSGRIQLTTSAGGGLRLAGDFFDLRVESDGTVTAEFVGGGDVADILNGFALQGDEGVFEPGTALAIAYELVTPSIFTYRISGDSVTGRLDLTGVPINAVGQFEHLHGTFDGTRRR